MTTNGLKSSEFWLSVLGVVALMVLVLHGDIEGTWAAGAIAAATLGYTGARTVVKSVATSGQAQVANFKADLASLAPPPEQHVTNIVIPKATPSAPTDTIPLAHAVPDGPLEMVLGDIAPLTQ